LAARRASESGFAALTRLRREGMFVVSKFSIAYKMA